MDVIDPKTCVILEWSSLQECFHKQQSLDLCIKTNIENIVSGSKTDFLPIAYFDEDDQAGLEEFKKKFLEAIERRKQKREEENDG